MGNLESLRNYLRSYNPPRECVGGYLNILLFGMVGAGKSSTINTFFSALDLEGRMLNIAPSGNDEQSLTPELRFYQQNFLHFWDPTGWNALTETADVNNVLRMILEGRVPPNTNDLVLERLLGLKVDKSPGPDGLHPRVLKEVAREIVDALLQEFNPSFDDQYPINPENVIHGVAFLFDMNTVSNIPQDEMKVFHKLQTVVAQKYIYRIVIGTNFDKLGIPEKYYGYIYDYKLLQEKFEKLSEYTGIDKRSMFAITNTGKGQKIDQTRCVLTLYILENMVRTIDRYLKSTE
ncbi:uncharacterized protein [Chiloscyllium punctatum]|uniref:uncharacterized protein isoform X2 n=1 Tax=Chiloscyllium punctatum TaxID=137246 RepID=UPI003B63EAED